MTTPNNGIPYVPENTLNPAGGLNLALDVIDALLQTAPISMALTAPPGSNDNGDTYLVAAEGGTATGAWANQENNLARYVAEGNFWQFYTAGTQVKLVYDRNSGGLYTFDLSSSPGSWVLAAGLGDAPSDGTAYARRDGAWDAFVVGVTVENLDSPPTQALEVSTLILDTGLEFVEVTGGVARIRAVGGPVVNFSGANLDADQTNPGIYYRFSHAGPTFTFDGDTTYVIGHEYHGRYVGAGVLTVSGVSGFTVNAPAGGGLEIPPDGTFTVKIVGDNEADLMGVTQ